MANEKTDRNRMNRRSFLTGSAMAMGALATGSISAGNAKAANVYEASTASTGLKGTNRAEPTEFIHACMTLGYRDFPFERALEGIKRAGYDHVSWGTDHREADGTRPVIAPDAPPQEAAEVARKCRDHGLEPVKMFSRVYPDDDRAVELLTNRCRQAEAAGMPYVLTFGHADGGDPDLWVERLRELGPIAADHGVTIVMKQHGGETTGTGAALWRIGREVDHPNIRLSYDAGNVLWYLQLDPIPDIRTCTDMIDTFCMKDTRLWPDRSTCSPGYGEVDHYRLFAPVAFTGRTITLAYETISPAYIGTDTPEEVDRWAERSREYMVHVIQKLQEE